MIRSSAKCKKSEQVAVNKVKNAIKSGNQEGARIYAQDAIREKKSGVLCREGYLLIVSYFKYIHKFEGLHQKINK